MVVSNSDSFGWKQQLQLLNLSSTLVICSFSAGSGYFKSQIEGNNLFYDSFEIFECLQIYRNRDILKKRINTVPFGLLTQQTLSCAVWWYNSVESVPLLNHNAILTVNGTRITSGCDAPWNGLTEGSAPGPILLRLTSETQCCLSWFSDAARGETQERGWLFVGGRIVLPAALSF